MAVNRWEKKYPTKTVRLFVEDALSVTRSPGKKEVYKAWLNEHPKPPELIPSIWANTIMERLKSSTAFHHQFTNNPEQPSGIILIAVDEAVDMTDDDGPWIDPETGGVTFYRPEGD